MRSTDANSLCIPTQDCEKSWTYVLERADSCICRGKCSNNYLTSISATDMTQYKQPDGSVLGDTKSVELTDAMIELGWHPPSPRSRWDLLPLVVMADGDKPYLIELPSNLQKTVRIRHPRFQQEFEQLDLRWVLCPALSRLGFDIGGVQYTAAPFVGWFMDAEIGVRNLADTFRYNVLPDIVDALKLSDRPDTPFDDLPEYLRLAALVSE